MDWNGDDDDAGAMKNRRCISNAIQKIDDVSKMERTRALKRRPIEIILIDEMTTTTTTTMVILKRWTTTSDQLHEIHWIQDVNIYQE